MVRSLLSISFLFDPATLIFFLYLLHISQPIENILLFYLPFFDLFISILSIGIKVQIVQRLSQILRCAYYIELGENVFESPYLE